MASHTTDGNTRPTAPPEPPAASAHDGAIVLSLVGGQQLICSDKALICSTRVMSTVSKARVMWAGDAVVAGTPRVRPAAAHEQGRVGAAAVVDGGQPGGETFDREPIGAVLAVEAGEETQADRGVDLGESRPRPGTSLAGERGAGSRQRPGGR